MLVSGTDRENIRRPGSSRLFPALTLRSEVTVLPLDGEAPDLAWTRSLDKQSSDDMLLRADGSGARRGSRREVQRTPRVARAGIPPRGC